MAGYSEYSKNVRNMITVLNSLSAMLDKFMEQNRYAEKKADIKDIQEDIREQKKNFDRMLKEAEKTDGDRDPEKMEELQKKYEESAEKKAPAMVEFSPQAFNYFAQYMKELKDIKNLEDEIPYVATNMGDIMNADSKRNRENSKKIMVFVRGKDAERVKFYADKAIEKARNKNRDFIPANDFYKSTYKEKVLRFPGEEVGYGGELKCEGKDEDWLYLFKMYAEKHGVKYGLEEVDREAGTYRVMIQTEKSDGKGHMVRDDESIRNFNKAIFETEWDFNMQEKAIQNYYTAVSDREQVVQQQNKEMLENIVINGGVYMVNVNNMNDKLLITKDGYERILGNRVIDSAKSTDARFNEGLERNKADFGTQKHHIIVQKSQYDRAQSKEACVADIYRSQNNIVLKKSLQKKMKLSHALRDEVMKDKDFLTLNFTPKEKQKAEKTINEAHQMILVPSKDGKYEQVKRMRDMQQAEIDKAKAQGALVWDAGTIDMSKQNFTQLDISLSETSTGMDIVTVDESMILIGEIREASELYAEKQTELAMESQLAKNMEYIKENGLEDVLEEMERATGEDRDLGSYGTDSGHTEHVHTRSEEKTTSYEEYEDYTTETEVTRGEEVDMELPF